MPMDERPEISVVIPAHNEEQNLLPLFDRLISTLERIGRSFEIVIVDDASTDGSVRLLANLARNEPRLIAVCLRRNSGQRPRSPPGSRPLPEKLWWPMDGDLQHAPEDIPSLLTKIDEGFDLVNGWRANRIDRFLTRRLPSKVANWLIRKLSGVELRDFGDIQGLPCRTAGIQLRLYGDLHRFIPVLAAGHGARIAEVPIGNFKRSAGRSHYGLGRTIRVFFDLITVAFPVALPYPAHAFLRIAWHPLRRCGFDHTGVPSRQEAAGRPHHVGTWAAADRRVRAGADAVCSPLYGADRRSADANLFREPRAADLRAREIIAHTRDPR